MSKYTNEQMESIIGGILGSLSRHAKRLEAVEYGDDQTADRLSAIEKTITTDHGGEDAWAWSAGHYGPQLRTANRKVTVNGAGSMHIEKIASGEFLSIGFPEVRAFLAKLDEDGK